MANIVFDISNQDFFKKQRILALINLVKSIRDNIENKNDKYSLNLIIRNLEAYKKNQKLGENYILNEDLQIVISTLITLAFSNGFNKIDETNIKKFLKDLQKVEEHQHQIFLKDLQKTLKYFDNQKRLQQMEILNSIREKDSDRLY